MRKLVLALAVLFAAVFMIAAPASAEGVGTGLIYVDSNIFGADVYIDGYYQGTAPGYFDLPITQNSHEVEVSEYGYSAYSTYAYAGDSIYAYLSPIPTPTPAYYGYISVSSSPSGADVYVDGSYQGSAPYTSSYMTGGHSVQVNIAGYTPYYENVYVSPGSTSNVYAVLTPSPVYSSTLSISSSPSGAEVYVDNAYRGITPLSLSDISAGYHTVSARLNGYTSWSEQIYFSEGTSVDRTVVLSAVPTPVPTKSPAPFIALIAGFGAAAFFALRRE